MCAGCVGSLSVYVLWRSVGWVGVLVAVLGVVVWVGCVFVVCCSICGWSLQLVSAAGTAAVPAALGCCCWLLHQFSGVDPTAAGLLLVAAAVTGGDCCS